eukprot:702876-Ditylum_brightwellii.AAC.1
MKKFPRLGKGVACTELHLSLGESGNGGTKKTDRQQAGSPGQKFIGTPQGFGCSEIQEGHFLSRLVTKSRAPQRHDLCCRALTIK